MWGGGRLGRVIARVCWCLLGVGVSAVGAAGEFSPGVGAVVGSSAARFFGGLGGRGAEVFAAVW